MPTKAPTHDKDEVKASTHKPQFVPAPASGPVGPSLNDIRADDEAVLGHNVEVTKGDDKGFYGVFWATEGDDAIVRSRADAQEYITVPIKDLVPADPFRR